MSDTPRTLHRFYGAKHARICVSYTYSPQCIILYWLINGARVNCPPPPAGHAYVTERRTQALAHRSLVDRKLIFIIYNGFGRVFRFLHAHIWRRIRAESPRGGYQPKADARKTGYERVADTDETRKNTIYEHHGYILNPTHTK